MRHWDLPDPPEDCPECHSMDIERTDFAEWRCNECGHHFDPDDEAEAARDAYDEPQTETR